MHPSYWYCALYVTFRGATFALSILLLHFPPFVQYGRYDAARSNRDEQYSVYGFKHMDVANRDTVCATEHSQVYSSTVRFLCKHGIPFGHCLSVIRQSLVVDVDVDDVSDWNNWISQPIPVYPTGQSHFCINVPFWNSFCNIVTFIDI